MLRTFIGIKIVSTSFEMLQSELKKRLPDKQINWVPSSNFHLTLKFLGDTEKFYLNSLGILLDHIASRNKTFTLEKKSLDYFGKAIRPNVLYISFHDNLSLTKLQQEINTTLTDLGFLFEEKPFIPHLTLARVKGMNAVSNIDNDLNQLNESGSTKLEIEKFQLFQSQLSSTGPKYIILKEFSLAKGDPLNSGATIDYE